MTDILAGARDAEKKTLAFRSRMACGNAGDRCEGSDFRVRLSRRKLGYDGYSGGRAGRRQEGAPMTSRFLLILFASQILFGQNQRDLQGIWTNATITPLERPKELVPLY